MKKTVDYLGPVVLLIFLAYLFIINAAAFTLMGADKIKSKSRSRRVSERRLFLIASAGGSLGIWVGMRVFAHKTRHAQFVFGMPAMVFIQAALIAAVYRFIE